MENRVEKGNKRKKTIVMNIINFIVPIIIAVVIAILIKDFVFYKVKVPTGSMIPTINKNEQFFVTKIYNTDKIERGEILVFYSEELQETLIKRVIGLPGDHISIIGGNVSVNGEELDEPYVKNPDNNYGEYQVPEGKFFFLGDNRADSNDSSKWNNPYIDGEEIDAKAQIRVYPFDKIGRIK